MKIKVENTNEDISQYRQNKYLEKWPVEKQIEAILDYLLRKDKTKLKELGEFLKITKEKYKYK